MIQIKNKIELVDFDFDFYTSQISVVDWRLLGSLSIIHSHQIIGAHKMFFIINFQTMIILLNLSHSQTSCFCKQQINDSIEKQNDPIRTLYKEFNMVTFLVLKRVLLDLF